MPFLRLNSWMAALCCSGDITRSFETPANPAAAMPAKQTNMPSRTTRPEVVPTTWVTNSPRNIGGIRVPNAAHNPRTTAIPSESPRYRIVRPKVRPHIPHNNPKKKDQNKAAGGDSCKTGSRSLVITKAKIHGAMIQLKKPPASQKVSQDQRFTPR